MHEALHCKIDDDVDAICMNMLSPLLGDMYVEVCMHRINFAGIFYSPCLPV